MVILGDRGFHCAGGHSPISSSVGAAGGPARPRSETVFSLLT